MAYLAKSGANNCTCNGAWADQWLNKLAGIIHKLIFDNNLDTQAHTWELLV